MANSDKKKVNNITLPLSIVSENFTINNENLENILKSRELINSPVAIISVCGDTRTGKSFLLTLLMLYIKHHKEANKFGNFDKNIESKFPWMGKKNPHTRGIWMWPQPFMIEGIDIPILLMDTQGLFGLGSDTVTSNKIFALSMLMSSIQIYNVFRTLQENHLDILYTFTEYGRAALQHCSQKKTPFQHLIFLIRDWAFRDDHEYGAAGGEELIKTLDVKDNQNQKAQTVRKTISRYFQSISGYLLPGPGEQVNNGVIKYVREINTTFKDYLEEFFKDLLDNQNIKPKEISGNAVNGSEIYDYFINYYNALREDDIISPISMIDATTKTSNLLAISKTMEFYKQNMSQSIKVLQGELLLREHDKAMRLAIKEFLKCPKYGEVDVTIEYMDELLNQMWSFFDSFDKKLKDHIQSVTTELENVLNRAFIHYKKSMDDRFDSNNNDTRYSLNFDKFKEADLKYYKEALEAFSDIEESGTDQLKQMYINQLGHKIANHYKILNEKMKSRYDQIYNDHQNKFLSFKLFFKEEVKNFLALDDISTLNDEKWIEENHKSCGKIALSKFKNELDIVIPEITNYFKERIKEHIDSDLERTKHKIYNELKSAENICLDMIDQVKNEYQQNMKEFENPDIIRAKHPEILEKTRNEYSKNIEEISTSYKEFCKKYLPLLESEIGILHDRNLNRGNNVFTFGNNFENHIKIAVVGDKNVGKSSIVARYVKNNILSDKESREKLKETPDVNARCTTVYNKREWFRYWDNTTVYVSIWDINTTDGSKKIPQTFLQNADGIVLVIDVTNSDTMLGLDEWIREINLINTSAKKYLLANKSDKKHMRHVTTHDVEQFSKKNSLRYKEVSAISGSKVDDAFLDLASLITTDKKLCAIS